MIGLLKTTLGRLGLATFTAAALVTALDTKPAQAQAAYGSYVGLGGSLGLNDDDNGDGDNHDDDDDDEDRKSTRLNSSHPSRYRMPSSA